MEKETHTKQNTEEKIQGVLNRIKHHEITAHSKLFFRLRMVAFIVLLVAICLTSILLCSFILFNVKMSGQPRLLEFGPQGIRLLFTVFPWVLFLVDIILIALASVLMRHLKFGYKVPGVYILIGALGIIAISGYLVESHTPLHRRLLLKADRRELPVFEKAYTRLRRAPPEGYGIYKGTVILREADVLHIDLDDTTGTATSVSVTVEIPNSANGPGNIQIGDSVFIAGKRVDNTIINARIKTAPRLPPPR
jgi:hypothetical protein